MPVGAELVTEFKIFQAFKRSLIKRPQWSISPDELGGFFLLMGIKGLEDCQNTSSGYFQKFKKLILNSKNNMD